MKKAVLLFTMLVMMCVWTVGASADSGMVYYSGTDHSYKRFDTAMTWNDAKAYAESEGGYLATITSQDENDFVWNALVLNQGVDNPWLGGFQPAGTAEPLDGWEWVTGEAWIYTNWHP